MNTKRSLSRSRSRLAIAVTLPLLLLPSVSVLAQGARPGAFSTVYTSSVATTSLCVGANTFSAPTTCLGGSKMGIIDVATSVKIGGITIIDSSRNITSINTAAIGSLNVNNATTIATDGTILLPNSVALTGKNSGGVAKLLVYVNGTNLMLVDRSGLGIAAGTSEIQITNANGSLRAESLSGTAAAFNGSAITGLNAAELTAGITPSARLSGSYTGITGVGTVTVGTWSGSFGTVSGANLTSLTPANFNSSGLNGTFTCPGGQFVSQLVIDHGLVTNYACDVPITTSYIRR